MWMKESEREQEREIDIETKVWNPRESGNEVQKLIT